MYAPILNALQFVSTEGIQVQQLRLTRSPRSEQIQAREGSGALPTTIQFEAVVMELVLRNYGDNPLYEAVERRIRGAEQQIAERSARVVARVQRHHQGENRLAVARHQCVDAADDEDRGSPDRQEEGGD